MMRLLISYLSHKLLNAHGIKMYQIVKFFLIVAALGISASTFCQATGDGKQDEQVLSTETQILNDLDAIGKIADWVKANGGIISDKLEVQHIVGSLSGLFANEDLPEGEIMVQVPWKLILLPPSHDLDHCDRVENIRQVLSTDQTENPYYKYLATRTREHLPYFWSPKAKEILAELMTDFVTNGFDEDVQDSCDGKMAEESYQHALMLLQTRGEGFYGDLLVPFEDLLNHRNGRHINVQAEISEGNHVRIVTNRPVSAGEQLQNSYNQCPYCIPLYSDPRNPWAFQVTPQLFEAYGFVELLPQRWVLPDMRLVFDIIQSEEEGAHEDNLEVDYIVWPSQKGLNHLRYRLYELRAFEQKHARRDDIAEHELQAIFSLHHAMITAYTLAIDHSEGYVSERVWQMGSHSWHFEKWWQDDDEDDTEDEDEEEDELDGDRSDTEL